MPQRLNKDDHPIKYRVTTLVLTACDVRRKLHRAGKDPCGPITVRDFCKEAGFGYQSWSDWTNPGRTRRPAATVTPDAAMVAVRLPKAWADPRSPVTGGRGAVAKAIGEAWNDPKQRKEPRQNKSGPRR